MNETVNIQGLFYEQPKPSKWHATLLGDVHFTPNEGCEPNAFHRFMQRLCFGIRWEKSP